MATVPTTNPIPEGFETFDEAKERRNHKIRVLNRGTKCHRRLGAEIQRCRKGDRCRSEACPICLRFFRTWLLKQACPIIHDGRAWTRASVIPTGMLIPCGKLLDVKLPRLINLVLKRLERSSLAGRIIIGGIDISLNAQDNAVVGWQFHLYLLIEGKHSKQLEEAVKAAFPPEPTAPAPYRFSPVADAAEAMSYAYKSIFSRRSRYTNDRGQTRTWSQSLKGSKLRKLVTWLGQYSVGCRLILRGVRRNGQRLMITQQR